MNFLERLWIHVVCVGYGIQARFSAIGHLLRGHDLRWRVNGDPWSGCFGDIECSSCPDSSDGKTDVIVWCRQNQLWSLFAQLVCGWLGHPDLRHPQRSTGWNEATNRGDYEDIKDRWYCYRCMADVEVK